MNLFKIPVTVSESIIINKPIGEVFSFISDYKNETKWSPWLIMEPTARIERSPETNKVGSFSSWDGQYIGAGKTVQTKLETDKTICRDLEFYRPWKSTATITFNFETVKGGTKVIWTMNTTLPFFMFWQKKTMAAWVGLDFKRGLSMCQEYLETGRVESEVTINRIEDHQEFAYIGLKTTCTLSEVGPAMEADVKKLEAFVEKEKINTIEPSFSIYHAYDPVKNSCTYTFGLAVENPMAVPEGFVSSVVKGGQALNITHKGSYRNLGNAWATGFPYAKSKKIKINQKLGAIEVYKNNPKNTKPADLVTEIYLPVK